MKTEAKKEVNRYTILLLIILIGMTFFIGLNIQTQYYNQTKNYCDNLYGVNRWELNETTGTGSNKYYIGQVWECVKKE